MRRLIPAAVLTAALAACASDPRPVPSPAMQEIDPTRYACNDGSFLSVRFGAGAAAVTMLDGSTATLPQRAAASGFLYASERLELSGKGDAATWTAEDSPPTACQAT